MAGEAQGGSFVDSEVPRTYFSVMEGQGCEVVEETPHFDIKSYIQTYTGSATGKSPSRFDRLMLIGRCSIPLCVEALKEAVSEALSGKDIQKYQDAWQCLHLACPNDSTVVLDQEWIDRTHLTNGDERRRLEAEIRAQKNKQIKDTIYAAHEQLAQHLEACGDLVDAAEAYALMRPDASMPEQLILVGKHMVRVAVQRRDWVMVQTQLSRISNLLAKDDRKNVSYTRAMAGLSLMHQGKHTEAAGEFLNIEIDPRATKPIKGPQGGEVADLAELSEGFIAANDVAVYGGLLALATLDRDELQERVLNNAAFRTFLEMEPHVRRAISQFVGGRYSACMATLATYRADWLLDLHLQRHVPFIFEQVRRKCMRSYLTPLTVAQLGKMEAVFGATSDTGVVLADDVAAMIKSGQVNARIDTIRQLVRTQKDGGRAKMQKDVLAAASKYEADTLDRLWRTNIIAAGLEAQGRGNDTSFEQHTTAMMEGVVKSDLVSGGLEPPE